MSCIHLQRRTHNGSNVASLSFSTTQFDAHNSTYRRVAMTERRSCSRAAAGLDPNCMETVCTKTGSTRVHKATEAWAHQNVE